MGDLIVSSLVSIDGVQHDPQSWVKQYFDAEAVEKSLVRLQNSEAMLMGRTTYEYFAASWPYAAGPYPDRINSMQKYVFSSTLESAEWNNTKVVSGDVVSEVTNLKQRSGDLVIYGFGQLARTLLENDLIDVLEMWINPVVLGVGKPMFRPGTRKDLRLESVQQRASGVVAIRYARS